MTVLAEERRPDTTRTAFHRVLVGIDGSEESNVAAHQAATLAEGEITLLAVYELAAGIVGGTGMGVPGYYDDGLQRAAAEDALRRARGEVPGVATTAKMARGIAWDELLREAERGHAALVAVGSHGVGRMAGIVMGSVATELVHKAPCSVLVARKARDGFPRRILLGDDGSPEAGVADEVARRLAWRLDAELVVEKSLEDPVTGLVEAAAEADLLVVGSRGLHGLKALGSVSERVAHRAPCSVLIVREPRG